MGSGAYALVKLATHKETGFQVAIKIYDKSRLNLNAQVKKSVSREIKLLGMLSNTELTSNNFGESHTNIMRLYDSIDTPRQLYLICEHVKGEMLSKIIKDSPNYRVPSRTAAKIFRQIAEAMAVYHSHHIAHRDLKPENVLVDLSCPKTTTKIIDFGFAA